jgi:hypothetical protein
MASNPNWSTFTSSTSAFPDRFYQRADASSRNLSEKLSAPALDSAGHGQREQSPAERYVRRMNKEGLPLARLWESHNALLSLGLNRKGKPGIWLIQKTR